MRQGQQNRRGRGRPNNTNRSSGNKGQNPLTRSHESNGPDVKIRGTPSHIAEKYITLARDALSAGDIVMAENYLQHAEHYNRIIMTFREQSQSDAGQGNNGRHNEPRQNDVRARPVRQVADDEAAQPDVELPVPGSEPQPQMSEQPQVAARAPRNQRDDGRSRRGGETRGGRSPRAARQPRNKMAANASDGASSGQGNGPANAPANGPANGNGSKPAAGSKISDGQDAPGFLRNSVAPRRRRRPEDADQASGAAAAVPVVEEDGV